MIAITHIQNTEPNPPIQIADDTPTIFPVPTLDAVETISAWNDEIASLSSGFSITDSQALSNKRTCGNLVRIVKYQTYTEEDKKLKEKSKEIREKETKIQISQKALQKILPKQEMLSEKLKELKSNTDKKQNIEKDIKEGEKIEEKNKIKLLKINELKEILDTYKKAKEKSNNLEEIFLLITRNNTRTKRKRTTSKKI